MSRVLFNQAELDALHGLTWVPQLLYFRVVRPSMNFNTGCIGQLGTLNKTISYELIRDQLQPRHATERTDGWQLSKKAIDNAFCQLVKAGLLSPIDNDGHFAYQCLLADTNSKRGSVS